MPSATHSEKIPFQRYQAKPYIGSSHQWAQERLLLLEPSAKILDIGPGSGVLGHFLHEKAFRNLYAVETDSSTALALQTKGIYQDIKGELDSFSGQQFNCVLLLDVLEHMADPFAYLVQLEPYLASNALVLISVPNIAHWSIRFSLLFGFFEYTDRGILDKTHLQFFNQRRFAKLCQTLPHCRVTETTASLEPAEFVLPQSISQLKIYKSLRRIQKSLADYLPAFFGYQHLACLRKGAEKVTP